MTTYVLVHGSFWGSWSWTDLARLLRTAGHDAYAPSLTGLGERVHLASPDITLDTHILDVSGTLTYEELQDVVLVGLSYGGMVITGVAERMPERIAHLVFLDAPVPKDGESLGSMMGPDWTEFVLEFARTQGDGWRFGSRRADMGDLSPQEQSWYGRATPQPIQTWLQPLAVRNPAAAMIPRTFIVCTDRQWPRNDFFDASAAVIARGAAAAREAGSGYYELPTAHHAMLSATQALASILLRLVPEGTAAPSTAAAARG
jgi:pimeloyl-ACP methyl ester carboxylesterase